MEKQNNRENAESQIFNSGQDITREEERQKQRNKSIRETGRDTAS